MIIEHEERLPSIADSSRRNVTSAKILEVLISSSHNDMHESDSNTF
jgi:hypothetical protein